MSRSSVPESNESLLRESIRSMVLSEVRVNHPFRYFLRSNRWLIRQMMRHERDEEMRSRYESSGGIRSAEVTYSRSAYMQIAIEWIDYILERINGDYDIENREDEDGFEEEGLDADVEDRVRAYIEKSYYDIHRRLMRISKRRGYDLDTVGWKGLEILGRRMIRKLGNKDLLGDYFRPEYVYEFDPQRRCAADQNCDIE